MSQGLFRDTSLEEAGLDETSYRPISNLTVISKLLERLVARQLVAYLDNHHLLPTNQSGFRRGYSTETATIRVLSDLLDAVDRGDTAALVLLNLSAAFDTVDHEILLERLSVTFGVTSSARMVPVLPRWALTAWPVRRQMFHTH